MSTDHRDQLQPAGPACALKFARTFLARASGPTNYERMALEEVVDALEAEPPEIHRAAQVAADAVDHAHRPHYTETRPEVDVCMLVSRCLQGALQ